MDSLRSFREKATPSKREFARALRNNATRSERRLWKELQSLKLGIRFRRQVIIFNWIVDFYCPAKKLVVELDGKYHQQIGQPEIDAYRDKTMSDAGYRILRIESARVFTDIVTVVAEIQMALGGFIY
jgi:very-short-patch-repair endonuclease